jgi:hypothetical protein
MSKISKVAAERSLEKLKLSDTNREFAGYWLSLWQGDALPRYDAFNPHRIARLVPNLLAFEALPEKSVVVRKAGREICRVAHQELDGADWITAAPLRGRGLRMRAFTRITEGAIMHVRRRMTMVSGPPRFNEELVLPFAPDADGIHPVLAHADWKLEPALKFHGIAEIEYVTRDHTILTIRRGAAAVSAAN